MLSPVLSEWARRLESKRITVTSLHSQLSGNLDTSGIFPSFGLLCHSPRLLRQMEKSYTECAGSTPRGHEAPTGALSEYFLQSRSLFEFLSCKTPEFTSNGRRVAVSGSGKGVPRCSVQTTFLCHPWNAPSSAMSACPLRSGVRHCLVFTALLEPRATCVTTVALCLVSLHTLGKPGCSQVEPFLPASTQPATLTPCPHLSTLPTTDARHPLVSLARSSALSHARTHPPGPHWDNNTLLEVKTPWIL